ncbi:MAG TPA: hypothetical protein VH592_18250, partial [Gemmataceae bacterium]
LGSPCSMAERMRVTSLMSVTACLENSGRNNAAQLRERHGQSLICVRVEPEEMSGLFASNQG